jgi:AcrR family transcriptional regulator
MSADKNPRGRPAKGRTDARIKLIQAARRCFATQAYRDVTTRMLAAEAGVNASLIRYYFLNKDGLYQQMLGDVALSFPKLIQITPLRQYFALI